MIDLENAGCIEVQPQGDSLGPSTLGRVASYYYLKYTSVALFHAELHDVDEGPTDLPTLLRVLCDASEFDELPVRRRHSNFLAPAAPVPVDARRGRFGSQCPNTPSRTIADNRKPSSRHVVLLPLFCFASGAPRHSANRALVYRALRACRCAITRTMSTSSSLASCHGRWTSAQWIHRTRRRISCCRRAGFVDSPTGAVPERSRN